MTNIYLISSGSYSDYAVNFLMESTKVVSGDEFRKHWLEAVKRKTEYVDNKLERAAKYLGVARQSDIWSFREIVGADTWKKALDKIDYYYKSESEFLEEIFVEHGFTILSFEEYNIDDF